MTEPMFGMFECPDGPVSPLSERAKFGACGAQICQRRNIVPNCSIRLPTFRTKFGLSAPLDHVVAWHTDTPSSTQPSARLLLNAIASLESPISSGSVSACFASCAFEAAGSPTGVAVDDAVRCGGRAEEAEEAEVKEAGESREWAGRGGGAPRPAVGPAGGPVSGVRGRRAAEGGKGVWSTEGRAGCSLGSLEWGGFGAVGR